jgi:signal transduction histidine kinase/HD-like signal output (HDOD) protein
MPSVPASPLARQARDVQDIVRRVQELPSPPSVATKIISQALQDSTDFGNISRLVESDQAIALKVLKLANSAAYGYREAITTVEQATAALGLTTLVNVMLSLTIRAGLQRTADKSDPQVLRLWKHSLAAAVTAQLLAERAAPQLKNAAFVAGLIHDCGKLAMLSVLGEEYDRLLALNPESPQASLDLEQHLLGLDHSLVGKWLVQKWGLPPSMHSAVWLHHLPPEALGALTSDDQLVVIVALADLMAHQIMSDFVLPVPEDQLLNLAERLKLGADDLAAIQPQIGKRYAERADIFDLENDAAIFYFEALQRANSKLAGFNLELERERAITAAANHALSALGRAAVTLTEAGDVLEVMEGAVVVLREFFNVREAFGYRLDPDCGEITGLIYLNGAIRPVRCRLGADFSPLDEDLADLPESFAGPLSALPKRLPPKHLAETVARGLGYHQPMSILPLMAGQHFVGEIIFRLEADPIAGAAGAAGELAGLPQLGALIASTLRRLSTQAKLESRSECLSSAVHQVKEANRKLLQTERLAAVGQLAAGAAHEINNPLAIVYARAQLLELKEEDQKKKKSLKQMMEQIERISSILASLMDFARPAPPRFELVDVNAVLDKTLSLIQGGLTKLNIELAKDLDPELPRVMGDQSQLEQVFLNLFINAEHAMELSGGRLTVTTRADAEGTRVVVNVVDSGVGIPPENVTRIFDPFFTTKEEGKGTGLGLSTSHAIITAHGGDIQVKSAPGKGTDMRVRLPVEPAAAHKAKADSAEERNSSQAILVVDDEKHIRDILAESLGAAGFSVETAGDGNEALAKLVRTDYRLLLVDIRMPGLDGLALLSRVKARSPELPVIVLTGLASKKEMEQAMSLGAVRCLRKPFQIDNLIGQVREVLAARGRP